MTLAIIHRISRKEREFWPLGPSKKLENVDTGIFCPLKRRKTLIIIITIQAYNNKEDIFKLLKALKKELLKTYDARGAEYPAEHNVGHEYYAKEPLRNHYKKLDPTNSFNPGIGWTSKKKNWQ